MASERRAETSRLEGFSDAVFAFALTLLVVSLEVPSSYDQLVHTLRSFVAFAPSFAALIWIWYLHREFFRRYGLGDGPMIVLNALLLFVVLLYVYPLKFLATLVLGQVFDPAARRLSSPVSCPSSSSSTARGTSQCSSCSCSCTCTPCGSGTCCI